MSTVGYLLSPRPSRRMSTVRSMSGRIARSAIRGKLAFECPDSSHIQIFASHALWGIRWVLTGKEAVVMSDEEKITGGCLCGAVRYESSQLPDRSACCHCRICQKSLGAPFVHVVFFSSDAFQYTSGEPTFYKSSDILDRGFCAECGTPLIHRYSPEIPNWGGWIGVTGATLDDPNEFPPNAHSGVESQLRWLKLADGLPRTEYVDDFISKWKSGRDAKELFRQV